VSTSFAGSFLFEAVWFGFSGFSANSNDCTVEFKFKLVLNTVLIPFQRWKSEAIFSSMGHVLWQYWGDSSLMVSVHLADRFVVICLCGLDVLTSRSSCEIWFGLRKSSFDSKHKNNQP
jgi:hypothetical protein